MAGAVELATAYIALVPSLKGASQKISEQLSPAAESSGAAAGDGLGRSILGTVAKWAAPVAAAVGFGAVIKTGFDEAKDAAAGTAQLAAGIASTGNAAHVSVDGMNNLASSIQGYSGQTDDSIVKSEQLLLTFTNIKNNGPDKIFDQATAASANMAAKFGGDASQQAVLLGKALNDPVKGITALQRVGVSFTDSQKKTIDAMVKTGDVAGAQKVILGELNTEFGGAAKAAGQSFPGQLQRVHRAFEDLSQGIVQGFLPVMGPALEGVIKILQKVAPVAAAASQHVADGAAKIGGAIGGVFNLFKTGDFTGGIGKALGVEEDSKIVDVILNIRGGFVAMFAAFKAGGNDVTSSGFAGFMERIGLATREVTGGVHAFFAAFKAGGNDVTSSGFAGFLEKLGLQARKLFDGVGPMLGQLLPQLMGLWGALSPVQLIFKSIQPMLPQLLGVFGQLAAVIGGTLGTALRTLVPVFMQLQAVFVRVFQQVLALALPIIVRLVTMLGQTFTQLVPIIIPIVTRIAMLAATLVSQLAPILMQLISAVMPMVITIFGAVASAIGPLIQILAAVLIPIIQALMPVVTVVFGVIANVITSVMQIIMGIIQVVTGIITGNWSMVWEGIKNVFGGIWNAIVAVVTGVFAIIWSVISGGLNLVAGFIGGVLGNIGKFFSDTWNNVVNGVSGMIGNVGKFFSGLWGTVTGALAGAGKWLWDAGVNVVQGLLDGIKSLAGTVGNFFLSLLPGWIVAPFKAALGIQSPSRLFKAFGGFIGEGLVIGLEGSSSSIRATSSKMAKEVINAFDHHAITRGMENRLLASISSANNTLERLASSRASVLGRLKNATTAYVDALKIKNDYAASITSSDMGGVDASKTLDLVGDLSEQISKTKELTTTLAQLKKMGLDSTTYKQLADGGLSSIPAAEELLSTGKSGISRVVALQKQLGTAAKGLGATAADNLYGAGVQSAAGLVNGLKSQSGAISRQMTIIAESMSSAIKKALGIRSPSTVFHGFGENIVEGLMRGVNKRAPEVPVLMENLVKVPAVPHAAISGAGVARYGATGAGITYKTTINQVDNPIGTAHAVQRRLTSLTV